MGGIESASYANSAGFNPNFGYTPDHPEFARLLGHLGMWGGGATHAISGFGGSGKSTIAASLTGHGFQVVAYDAYYTGRQDVIAPDWETYDLAGLVNDVLDPLAQGKPGCYHPRDWLTGDAGEAVMLDPRLPTVVEGVGLFKPGLAEKFTGAKVWVDRPLQLAARDGIKRAGVYADMWHRFWVPSDSAFFLKHNPPAQATHIFDRSKEV